LVRENKLLKQEKAFDQFEELKRVLAQVASKQQVKGPKKVK